MPLDQLVLLVVENLAQLDETIAGLARLHGGDFELEEPIEIVSESAASRRTESFNAHLKEEITRTFLVLEFLIHKRHKHTHFNESLQRVLKIRPE